MEEGIGPPWTMSHLTRSLPLSEVFLIFLWRCLTGIHLIDNNQSWHYFFIFFILCFTLFPEIKCVVWWKKSLSIIMLIWFSLIGSVVVHPMFTCNNMTYFVILNVLIVNNYLQTMEFVRPDMITDRYDIYYRHSEWLIQCTYHRKSPHSSYQHYTLTTHLPPSFRNSVTNITQNGLQINSFASTVQFLSKIFLMLHSVYLIDCFETWSMLFSWFWTSTPHTSRESGIVGLAGDLPKTKWDHCVYLITCIR